MKRKLLSFCALAFTAVLVNAQMPAAITMTPPDASGKHLITLTFDPSKACESDKAITADDTAVYMHASAHTFNPITQWGNFGVDYNAEPGGGYTTKWVKSDTGTWSITFVPQTYFKVHPDSLITGISLVLNIGSWDREGKDVDAAGDGNCDDFKIQLSTDTTNLNTAVNSKKVNSFSIYPNPVVSELYVNNDKNISYAIVSDVIGKVILKVSGNSNKNLEIGTQSLPKGLYILTVYDANGFAGSSKFVKK